MRLSFVYVADADLKKIGGRIFAYPSVAWDIAPGKGQALLIDMELPAAAAPLDAWNILKGAMKDFAPAGKRHSMIAWMGKNLVNGLSPKPDFASMRLQLPAPMRDRIESQWLLSLMNLEYAWNIPAADACAAMWEIDNDAVAALSRGVVETEPMRLVLEPAGK